MRDGLRIPGGFIPITEIELRASRSSGPGGQHANKTSSRIEALFEIRESHSLGEEAKRRLEARFGPRVTAVAQDARSQARNRELALERLEERIAAALKPRRRRRATKPSRSAKERRLTAKRHQSQRKASRKRPSADD